MKYKKIQAATGWVLLGILTYTHVGTESIAGFVVFVFSFLNVADILFWR